MLTEDGKKYGLPVAAFALYWSFQNKKSLFEVLGSTASSGKVRAPLQRVNILKVLDKGDCSASNIEEAIGANNTLYNNHLFQLYKTGFISDPGEGLTLYPSNPYHLIEIPSSFSALPFSDVSKEIVELLDGGKSIRVNEIAKQIKRDQKYVSNVLGTLFASGYVGNKLGERLSMKGSALNLKIEDGGKRFLDDFVYPLEDAMRGGSALEMMRDIYEVIIGDDDIIREYGRSGCKLYREVSPRLNQKGNTAYRVYDFVSSNPRSRPKDISNALGLKVDNALTVLRKKEKVFRDIEGNSSYYSIV